MAEATDLPGLTEEDFLESGTMIQLGYPPNRIDLVNTISGVAVSVRPGSAVP
jgi:hypothetical protein